MQSVEFFVPLYFLLCVWFLNSVSNASEVTLLPEVGEIAYQTNNNNANNNNYSKIKFFNYLSTNFRYMFKV